jgi:hypothetical protein
MYRGRVVGTFERGAYDRYQMGELMIGGRASDE